MFEFMGLRIPVVAPRLEPILDVQRDGETALLFDPLDRAQCGAAIERLLASPGLRQEMAARAYAKLVAEHTWHQNAAQIIEAAGLPVAARAAWAETPLSAQPIRPAA